MRQGEAAKSCWAGGSLAAQLSAPPVLAHISSPRWQMMQVRQGEVVPGTSALSGIAMLQHAGACYLRSLDTHPQGQDTVICLAPGSPPHSCRGRVGVERDSTGLVLMSKALSAPSWAWRQTGLIISRREARHASGTARQERQITPPPMHQQDPLCDVALILGLELGADRQKQTLQTCQAPLKWFQLTVPKAWHRYLPPF